MEARALSFEITPDTGGTGKTGCGASAGRVSRKNGPWLTAGLIVADIVGVGVLGIPVAVARFGWALGGLALVAMLAVNVHIVLLLWQIRVRWPPCASADTYTELCAGAFAMAPAWQCRLAVLLGSASQLSFIFALVALYLLSAGKGLGMAFHGTQLCLPTWELLGGLMLLPFAMTARDMGAYPGLVWLNVLTICGTVMIPLGFYAVIGTGDIRPEHSEVLAVSTLNWDSVLTGLSTFTFAMTPQIMITEIISEMEDPMQLPRAYVAISVPFLLAACLTIGLGGYCFMGDQVQGMLSENLPFGLSMRLAAACLVVHMLISYLIKGLVFCRAMLAAAGPGAARSDNKSLRAGLCWGLAVVLTFVAAWLLANLVPFFSDAVDLIGATLTPLVSWVIPIAMYVRWSKDAGLDGPRISRAEWLLLSFELVLGFCFMVFSTRTAYNSVVGHWDEYGPPFACHCEGIWKTCQCSGTHVGLLEECPAKA